MAVTLWHMVFLHDINIQELEWNILCLVPQIKVNSRSAGHTHISCSCSASHKVELFVNHSHPPPLSLLTLHKADTLNTINGCGDGSEKVCVS